MKIFCLALILVALFSFSALGQDETKAEEAIKKIFPDSRITTTEARTFKEQKVKVYRISAEDKFIGWAVVLDEMGKVKPITFLVGIDTRGKVAGVSVLEYRDMFGSEIKRSSFLRQFQGKSLEDKINIGADIDAITSATISSQAAASAVRKAILIIAQLQNGDSYLA
jgi:Na+-translocating ferredoxin:NAD+ oxidoreductase RnfG subunit